MAGMKPEGMKCPKNQPIKGVEVNKKAKIYSASKTSGYNTVNQLPVSVT
jgi:hypothetical protein